MRPLTVAQLIAELEDLDPDAIVVMGKRGAIGHSSELSPLEIVTRGWYVPETADTGTLETARRTGGSVAAVALWPAN